VCGLVWFAQSVDGKPHQDESISSGIRRAS